MTNRRRCRAFIWFASARWFPSVATSVAVIGALIAALAPPGVHARGRTMTFHFDRDRLAFGSAEERDVVRYEGLDLSFRVGAPQLPMKVVQVALPPGMDIGEVRVVRAESETLDGRYRLLPVQPPQPLSRPPAGFVEGDASIFASADPYPVQVVSASGEGFAAGFNLGALVIYPLQYIPAQGTLIFHSSIEVEVTWVPSARRPQPFRPNAYAERVHRDALERMLGTSDGLARPAENGLSSAALPAEDHPYVIVTNIALADEFQVLADWKTQKGLSAEVVTTDYIQSAYAGVDLASKIRAFVQDAYANWGTVWVLLGGDTGIIPARKAFAMACGYGGIYDEIPCDLYYGDLDGDWNADADAIYGEVSDNIDMYPDVFVGRAPVETSAEAVAWVRKVRIYEDWEMRPAGPWHELDMLFLAEILWSNPYTNSGESKDYIDASFVPSRFDPIEKLYEALVNENWSTVMTALNAGRNIVNHNGHAWHNTMGIGNGSLFNTDMDGLTNEYRPSILYSIGCWPGAIDYDCIAEHFLCNPTGGGVAFIGNSRYGWSCPGNSRFGYSDRFDQQFFKQLFVDGVFHIGRTLAAAKSFYAPLARQENVYRWCEYEINLLGDPEMAVYTDAEALMDVACPAQAPVGQTVLPVTVTRASDGAPVSGARVCAAKSGEVYATGFTGADGRAVLEVAPSTPAGNVIVTVTAHNMKVSRTSIPVLTGEPWVQASFYATNGSAEGYFAPGGEVDVDVCFKNYGSLPASGLSAVMRSPGSSVAVIDSTEFIGALPAGDSVIVSSAFRFSSGAGLENGDVLHLELEISDNAAGTWPGALPVTCATPVVLCDHHELSDAASGDGDGFAEPGETVSLHFRLLNAGLADGETLAATVSSGSPYLAIPPDPLSIGSLSPGERRTAHVEVAIDPSCPEPHFPVVILSIDAGGGLVFSDSVFVAVGATGFRDDMENGEGPWSRDGTPDLWHLTTHRAHSGETSWYCGVEGAFSYAAGMNGTLSTPPFTAGEDTELKFWCWYDCATYGVDGMYVELWDGSVWRRLDFLGSGGALGALNVGNGWIEYAYDLSDISPETSIAARFRFVSDADASLGEGVYVDDVSVGPKAPEVVVGVDPPDAGASSDALFQNHPNPFNPSTKIRYRLSSAQRTRIEIFDIRGSRVRVLMDRVEGPGPGEVAWDGRNDRGENVSTGIYFYRLSAGGFTQTRKMAVLK